MLKGHAQPARRPEDADGPGHVQPAGQRSVEVQDKGLANVLLDPLIENLYQESPPLGRPTDRSVTLLPSWNPLSLSRSTIGMNWM